MLRVAQLEALVRTFAERLLRALERLTLAERPRGLPGTVRWSIRSETLAIRPRGRWRASRFTPCPLARAAGLGSDFQAQSRQGCCFCAEGSAGRQRLIAF